MGQQVRIEETIAAMKRAMKRSDSTSESDDSIQRPTNRGNKLKRKAKYVQEGHLDLAAGPRSYKRRIDFNGYIRHIISRNPPRVDLDGDIIDDDDDGLSSAAELTPAEDDPYREIKLESLLKPLSTAAELKDHPSLSIPFCSPILEEMVQNAQEMVHRESAALWRMKQVLTGLRGDEIWVPCGIFLTNQDLSLLRNSNSNTSGPPSTTAEAERDEHVPHHLSDGKLPADAVDFAKVGMAPRETRGERVDNSDLDNQDANKHPATHDFDIDAQYKGDSVAAEERYLVVENASDGQQSRAEKDTTGTEAMGAMDMHKWREQEQAQPSVYGDERTMAIREQADNVSINSPATSALGKHQSAAEGEEADAANSAAEDEQMDDERQGHRMTTRARAQAETSETFSASDDGQAATAEISTSVHPFFVVPSTVLPDKSNGLASELADETRKLLCAYIQKQEEICRGAQDIYRGLLRALRLRRQVLEWCTAEAHVGEMSDGEDWYDKERWRLEDDLKKGEEVEDDDANTTGKKTRNRRAAA